MFVPQHLKALFAFRNRCQFYFLLLVFAIQSSCKTYHNVAYFKDIPDSATFKFVPTASFKPLQIQPGDALYISIVTIDPAANAVFNQSMGVVGSGIGATAANAITQMNNNGMNLPSGNTGNSPMNSYVVNAFGNISLPMIGSVKALDLTIDSLQNLIRNKTSYYYKDPVVAVKFANLRVNVLGEVQKPGTYNLVNEQNTVLDALALAGDLTIYGRRENVLLIRDSAGVKQMNRINLNSHQLLDKPYYYLRQNDVVYVEPAKEKIAAMDVEQTRRITIGTTIATSILSLLIIIATRAK